MVQLFKVISLLSYLLERISDFCVNLPDDVR